MRYSLDLQQTVVHYSKSHSVPEASKEFNIPINVIQSWIVQDMDEVKLKFHIQQKFYNLIPIVEAKITSVYSESDFIVYGITDEEWDECSSKINKVIVETVSQVYRAVLKDPLFLDQKPKKKKKNPDPYHDLPFLPGME
ncbi:MAG: hypothetical protein MJZ11_08620 [Lachnospiraceae bacterium]|nr:hypothetical protein [Lachnospiraceae bacterium]